MSESLRAHLLVAVPHLPDMNFYRTVVLMIQHDEDGAFGVVLNRPSQVRIADIWDQVADRPCDRQDRINIGGPVQGPLLAVHTDTLCADGEVMPGIYVTTDRDKLDQLVRQDEHPFRLFSGYSGWGSGQLEGELKAGGWFTMPATAEHIFCDPEDLWTRVRQEINQELLLDKLHILEPPEDPSVN